MKGTTRARSIRMMILILLTATLFGGFASIAQAQDSGIWIEKTKSTSITVAWSRISDASYYDLSIVEEGYRTRRFSAAGSTTFGDLKPNTSYRIFLVHDGQSANLQVKAHTKPKPPPKPEWQPLPVTCPDLPSRVLVTGFAKHTQCQMVSQAQIGRLDLIERGFIDAVDIWQYVNGGLDVCFRNDGWLVFLDATYLIRKQVELEHFYRDGMICGAIDRIGTVVLVATPPATQAQPQPAEPAEQSATLPVFDAIPLADCQIKLVETLFLRATPGGEIIGLVWLNSEVPAFEINGYWYRIEFEGKVGYISRYFRKVLRGGCG